MSPGPELFPGDEPDDHSMYIRVFGRGAEWLPALHRWLSLEDWFVQARARDLLEIAYVQRTSACTTARRWGADQRSAGLLLMFPYSPARWLSETLPQARTSARAWAVNADPVRGTTRVRIFRGHRLLLSTPAQNPRLSDEGR